MVVTEESHKLLNRHARQQQGVSALPLENAKTGNWSEEVGK